MKTLLKKAKEDNTDQYEAILELRNTPRQDYGLSPAELVFGNSTRSIIPQFIKHKQVPHEVMRKKLKRQDSIKKYYDKTAHSLPKLAENQSVYFQKTPNNKWSIGIIIEVIDERSYLVRSIDGAVYRRNRRFLRPSSTDYNTLVNRAARFSLPLDELPNKPDKQADKHVVVRNPNEFGNENEPNGSKQVEPIVPHRPQRDRKKPKHLEDYDLYSVSVMC